MLIANPIYDTVFKFLMEDLTVARRLISIIIGEEILELEPKPQEVTTPSHRYMLTILRMDYKAVVKTASGKRKKILIELQKSNSSFDILRFRHYLGANYSQADEVDGVEKAVPLLPIYFLGFNLSIKRAVLKIGRNYQDASTGEVLDSKDDFIENLSHDCFVVQIPNLPHQTKTKLEKVLSVFDQKWVFDEKNKWILKYPGDAEDTDVALITKRLAFAAESEEIKNQIQVEEEFDHSMDNLLRAKELIIVGKEKQIEQQNAEILKIKKKADVEKKKLEAEKKKTDAEKRKADARKIEIDDLQSRIAQLKKLLKK